MGSAICSATGEGREIASPSNGINNGPVVTEEFAAAWFATFPLLVDFPSLLLLRTSLMAFLKSSAELLSTCSCESIGRSDTNIALSMLILPSLTKFIKSGCPCFFTLVPAATNRLDIPNLFAASSWVSDEISPSSTSDSAPSSRLLSRATRLRPRGNSDNKAATAALWLGFKCRLCRLWSATYPTGSVPTKFCVLMGRLSAFSAR
ncbi:hypothetical protein D3C81_1490720 [compost metagenome]